VQFFNKDKLSYFKRIVTGDKNYPYLCLLFGLVNYYPIAHKYKQLIKNDKIEIHTLLSCNKTQKQIAQLLMLYFTPQRTH
jgi:hypothetical protein